MLGAGDIWRDSVVAQRRLTSVCCLLNTSHRPGLGLLTIYLPSNQSTLEKTEARSLSSLRPLKQLDWEAFSICAFSSVAGPQLTRERLGLAWSRVPGQKAAEDSCGGQGRQKTSERKGNSVTLAGDPGMRDKGLPSSLCFL